MSAGGVKQQAMTGKQRRSLKISCPTWAHLESFLQEKLQGGNSLSVRLPSTLEKGTQLNIALVLPNETVIAIDATITASAPSGDDRRAAAQIALQGLTPSLRDRLLSLASDNDSKLATPIASVQHSQPSTEQRDSIPLATPTDAPIDERIEPRRVPTIKEISLDEREVFSRLDCELKRMREAAAHQVLDVTWDADVTAIRDAYFGLTKQFHPDVYARFASAGIHYLAEEIFICINRAYDRMRDAMVTAGTAIVAGPALLPHQGWLASFDDLDSSRGEALKDVSTTARSVSGIPRVTLSPPTTATPNTSSGIAATPTTVRFASPSHDGQESTAKLGDAAIRARVDAAAEQTREAEKLADRGHDALDRREYTSAMREFSAALQLAPRDRKIRALFEVARGHVALAQKQVDKARADFNAALAHDPDSIEASKALESLSIKPGKKTGLFRKLFS